MKKINKICSIAIAILFLSTTQCYAEQPVVNKYVQLKDGVAFAYVESPGFVGNSILLPEGVSWEDVKFKKYENGSWATASVINTVTELVNNEVVQTQNTVFASDAKGDVVSQDVQLGWYKDPNQTYVNTKPEILSNSVQTGSVVDTTTILVNIAQNINNDPDFKSAAVLSTVQSNQQTVTVVQSNGLKTTNNIETKEQIFFDSPKTIKQIEESLNNNSMIKKYLNIFLQLLHNWIVIPIIEKNN